MDVSATEVQQVIDAIVNSPRPHLFSNEGFGNEAKVTHIVLETPENFKTSKLGQVALAVLNKKFPQGNAKFGENSTIVLNRPRPLGESRFSRARKYLFHYPEQRKFMKALKAINPQEMADQLSDKSRASMPTQSDNETHTKPGMVSEEEAEQLQKLLADTVNIVRSAADEIDRLNPIASSQAYFLAAALERMTYGYLPTIDDQKNYHLSNSETLADAISRSEENAPHMIAALELRHDIIKKLSDSLPDKFADSIGISLGAAAVHLREADTLVNEKLGEAKSLTEKAAKGRG